MPALLFYQCVNFRDFRREFDENLPAFPQLNVRLMAVIAVVASMAPLVLVPGAHIRDTSISGHPRARASFAPCAAAVSFPESHMRSRPTTPRLIPLRLRIYTRRGAARRGVAWRGVARRGAAGTKGHRTDGRTDEYASPSLSYGDRTGFSHYSLFACHYMRVNKCIPRTAREIC